MGREVTAIEEDVPEIIEPESSRATRPTRCTGCCNCCRTTIAVSWNCASSRPFGAEAPVKGVTSRREGVAVPRAAHGGTVG
jgi:hypothetical protein